MFRDWEGGAELTGMSPASMYEGVATMRGGTMTVCREVRRGPCVSIRRMTGCVYILVEGVVDDVSEVTRGLGVQELEAILGCT